jgi:DNA polymerase III gamma/tau subunit
LVAQFLSILQTTAETVFRRLNASMLGMSALKSVQREAVALYCSEFAEHGVDSVVAENFEVVSLYYHDVDGDKILIFTDKDFYNTVKEYTAAKATSLKFIAKIASKEVSQQKLAPSVATQTAESADAARKPETSAEAVQKNVIDALSDLVTIAAASVEAAVSEASSKSVAKQQLQAAKKASKDSIKAAKNVTRESLRAAKQATRVSLKQARSSVRSAVQAYSDTVAGMNQPPAAAEAEPAVAAEEAQKEVAPPAEEHPFIHGRHTCDSCLTTPIVGKRFNAVNLPDYDLCEVCFGNYNGTDVFVETVLGT